MDPQESLRVVDGGVLNLSLVSVELSVAVLLQSSMLVFDSILISKFRP